MILRTAQESCCKLLSEWAQSQSKEGGEEPRQGLESEQTSSLPFPTDAPGNIPAPCTSHGCETTEGVGGGGERDSPGNNRS